MRIAPKTLPQAAFLGIDGGGSNTVAILADAGGSLLKRIEAGPSNLKLLTDMEMRKLFASIAAQMPKPSAMGIGLAGARLESDRQRIRAAAAAVWRGVPCIATNDLEIALNAAEIPGSNAKPFARILVLSGTGSCAYGRLGAELTERVGGWGHLLGDQGSGYDIALTALRRVILDYENRGDWCILGQMLLTRLCLNNPDEFIPWIQNAPKAGVASLAPVVFEAAAKGDKLAEEIIGEAAGELARAGLICARKLAPASHPFQFVLAGSILLKQPGFAAKVAKLIKAGLPNSRVTPLEREAAWGGVVMAKSIASAALLSAPLPKPVETPNPKNSSLADFGKVSPTEQRNPLSLHLDTMPIIKAVELMLGEDAKIPAAILKEKKQIAGAVRLISRAFKTGGRLFYAGAGTSGRLGVLDASECPPTFRTDPDLVQGIMAGGREALWRAVEGAEDDAGQGAKAVEFRKITAKDVVVGIAASGRTPFVWGALAEAKKRKAGTVLLAFNPFIKISADARPDIVITPNLGPEILTGSTRLKSGTATKLILNIFTTLAMVQNGKVISNLMVDMNPSNEKLRDRAVRMLCELHPASPDDAQKALESSGWIIKKALVLLKKRR